jgi:ribonuclease P protein component
VVPKHKHSSVERNRLKRRLRELVRTHLLPELPAMDVVVRTLPEAYAAPFDALADQIQHVSGRLRRPGGAP